MIKQCRKRIWGLKSILEMFSDDNENGLFFKGAVSRLGRLGSNSVESKEGNVKWIVTGTTKGF